MDALFWFFWISFLIGPVLYFNPNSRPFSAYGYFFPLLFMALRVFRLT